MAGFEVTINGRIWVTAEAEKQHIFAAFDEAGCSQIEDQTSIHLGVEAEVELIERTVGIAKSRFLAAAFQQPVTFRWFNVLP